MPVEVKEVMVIKIGFSGSLIALLALIVQIIATLTQHKKK
jgi:uncharacterized protein with PQ loop repeat